MKANRRVYFHNGKPPFYLLPMALLLGIVIFSVLAIFGFFIGIVISAAMLIFGIIRFFSSDKKRKTRKMSQDGRTVILEEDEYKILKNEKKP